MACSKLEKDMTDPAGDEGDLCAGPAIRDTVGELTRRSAVCGVAYGWRLQEEQ